MQCKQECNVNKRDYRIKSILYNHAECAVIYS
jgi:hypothetical protein